MDKQFFLCIGAQKAGTTWLHRNLSAHDQVCLPRFKELHYFDTAHGLGVQRVRKRRKRVLARMRERLGALDTLSKGQRNRLEWYERFVESPVEDDRWYRSLFEPGPRHRAVGEITPAYAILPPEGVAHVKSFAPDAKIVYIMRNPVDRLISNRRMAIGKSLAENEEPTIDHWLRDYDTRDPMLDHSRYDLIVPKWEEKFGGQILFLFYEEMHGGTSPLKSVCEHIGVDYDPSRFPQEKEKVAPTRKVPVPEEVVARFTDYYRPTIEWAAKRFGSHVDRWAATLQTV